MTGNSRRITISCTLLLFVSVCAGAASPKQSLAEAEYHLQEAIESRDCPAIERILAADKSARLLENIGYYSALGYAATIDDNGPVIRLLIRKGANVNFRHRNGWTPLFYAVRHQQLENFRELLAAGADTRCKDDAANGLIHMAVAPLSQEHRTEVRASAEMVAAVIRAKCDLNSANKAGVTALQIAIEDGRIDIVRMLKSAGATERAEANADLIDRANHDDATGVELAIRHGADPNFVDYHGHTALMNASRIGSTRVAEDLVARGAKLSYGSGSGFTALTFAVGSGKPAMVDCLLKLGADVSARDTLGSTPLQLAVIGDRLAIAELLLQNGARIEDRDGAGNTTLIMASQRCYSGQDPISFTTTTHNPHLVRMLLIYGARVNARNDAGETALHCARASGAREIAETLIRAGAVE